ncbi:unnamed protein product [Allacma fusca]|uniref:Uncharacterized protein n=1 Tax=Allacma fusca TaxID=39272 RepID=A0A8J2PIS5_9HEXA|nr:unnamed protein product [Allacma fusca]
MAILNGKFSSALFLVICLTQNIRFLIALNINDLNSLCSAILEDNLHKRKPTKITAHVTKTLNTSEISINSFSQIVEVDTFSASNAASSVTCLAPSSVENLSELLQNVYFTSKNGSASRILFLCWPKIFSNNTVEQITLSIEEEFERHSVLRGILRMDTHVYASTFRNNFASPKTYEFFYYLNGPSIVVQEVLLTSKNDVFNEFLRISSRRSDFKLTSVRVLVQEDPILSGITNFVVKNGIITLIDGQCVEILNDFQKMLNFSVKLVRGQGWIEFENTTKGVSGIGAQILDNQADLAISASTLFPYRQAKLRFLQPVHSWQAMVFYSEPPLSSRNILMGTTTNFAKQTPLLIIGLTTLCTSFLAFSFYTGAFVATVSSPASLIKSYEYLKTFEFQIFSNPSHDMNVFISAMTMNQDTGRDNLTIWENSRRSFHGYRDVVEKITSSSSRYAFLYNNDLFLGSSRLEDNHGKDICKIRILKGTQTVKRAMFLRKDSPLYEIFAQRTVLLNERGLNSRYREKYLSGILRRCLRLNQVSEYVELQFEHVALAFQILAVGFGTSLFLMISIERLIYSH